VELVNEDKSRLLTPVQAYEKNRKLLEAQSGHSYPLEATGHQAEVPESQSNTGKPLEQR